jgi:hypothetical protein
VIVRSGCKEMAVVFQHASYHQRMNRNTAERIKSVELALLHAKAQLRPNATRIRDLESELAKLKKEI